MESYYESRVAEFGDPPGSGFCDYAERAENAFIHPRWPAVHEVGRLLCFRDARGAPCSSRSTAGSRWPWRHSGGSPRTSSCTACRFASSSARWPERTYDAAVFGKTERLYDQIYAWKDYAGEVARLESLIDARLPSARSLLDVACGTGKHLELLRRRFEVAGVDADPVMVDIARERLGPDVPLHVADMADFDLGRRFDVVTCLFSSIAYVRTDDRLRSAVAGLVRHATPGGLIVVEPWFTPDQWTAGHLHAIYVDEPDLKVARLSLSGPLTDPLTMTFHYLVGTPDGIKHLTEDHVVGMFTADQYVDAFRAAGVEPDHDPEGLMGRGLYVGVRPA
jgi:SAM-dependent methyltransferase